MPSKNDLNALKAPERKNILPKTGLLDDGVAVRTEGHRPATGRGGQGGRPPKALEEKRSYRVSLSLTQAEGEKVKAKAGLANEATLIYHHLKETGFFD